MTLAEAQLWIASHSMIVHGYYVEGDKGQPDPSTVYCIDHAKREVKRLIRKTGVEHWYCEAGASSDMVEHCGVKTCDVTLNTGGLTDHGVRWALGMDEENPLSFVATIDELEMAQRALSSATDPLWDLWLSQVLRLQRGVTKKQCLAFEAAWLADDKRLALDLLRERPPTRRRRRQKSAA